ncbi:MAG: response regulator [Steroidobacteraceae bacterium]|jgi:two-component system response regulator
MDQWNAVEILLAEDNEGDAELTLRALRKLKVRGKLLRVHNGLEALSFIFREAEFAARDQTLPKLILLDIHMPILGGLEVLRRLRATPSTQHIPVGILTGSSQENEFFESQQLLVWEYILKPVSADALKDLIAQAGL